MSYMGSKMFYAHAQISEPAQCVLHAYWMGETDHAMPTGGCSVCMPILIINFKLRGVEQNSVPYVMKVILTHIPIECGVVDPYVYVSLCRGVG